MINEEKQKNDQKMKPYLVYEYLMRYSDANHVVSANELVGYLQECGISAERRSIYKDIEEINKALLLTQRDDGLILLTRYASALCLMLGASHFVTLCATLVEQSSSACLQASLQTRSVSIIRRR